VLNNKYTYNLKVYKKIYCI